MYSPNTDKIDVARQNELRNLFPASFSLENVREEAAQVREVQALFKEGKEKDYEDLLTRVEKGEGFTPKEIHLAFMTGDERIKQEVRSALLTPESNARNQDLVLPHMKAALSGNAEARTFIEKNRFIFEETIPEWFKPVWEAQRDASWRVLDLHSAPVRKAAKKLRSHVYPQYKTKRLGPVSEEQLTPSVRDFLFSFSQRVDAMEHFTKAQVDAGYSRHQILTQMAAEVERDIKTVLSPTIISSHYRKVVIREAHQLFAARLIDDVCLWHDLPYSGAVKAELWKDIETSPWMICRHPLIKYREAIKQELMHGEVEQDDMMERFDTLFFNHRARLTELYHQSRKQGAGQKQTPTSPEEAKGTAQEADREEPQDAVRSLRLELLAALETYSPKADLVKEHARKLARLVGTNSEAFQDTMMGIYREEDPESLILELRRKRPVSVLKPEKTSSQGDVTFEELRFAPDESAEIEPRQEREVSYCEDALERMQDGRLRHATAIELDKFVETPELIDRKRVRQTDDVWEIRLVKKGIRIYFREPGDHLIEVVLVGLKRDQDADIRTLRNKYSAK